MFEFFAKLFDTADFPARWYCGNWSSGLGWMHIISDWLIWGAYMSIPIALVYFLRRREGDFLFPRVLLLFCAFIAACGTVHLVESLIFWYPVYRLSGLVKLVTAIVSWLTVAALIRLAPSAVKIPGLLKMNDALTRRNQELDEYAHVVSHDLRAPLQGIALLAEWIAEDSRDKLDEENLERLELLMNRVTRMGNLVDGILEHSKIGLSRVPTEDLDSRRLVTQTVELLMVPETITVTIADELPTVRYNRQHLSQVFQNLIGNAVKHMGDTTGRVEVSAADLGPMWEFSVSDTGPGIAPEHFERIFKMFQVLSAESESTTSGIGLSIVKKIVTQYGGEVRVRSTLGEGATFSFTIPKDLSIHDRISRADAALVEHLRDKPG